MAFGGKFSAVLTGRRKRSLKRTNQSIFNDRNSSPESSRLYALRTTHKYTSSTALFFGTRLHRIQPKPSNLSPIYKRCARGLASNLSGPEADTENRAVRNRPSRHMQKRRELEYLTSATPEPRVKPLKASRQPAPANVIVERSPSKTTHQPRSKTPNPRPSCSPLESQAACEQRG